MSEISQSELLQAGRSRGAQLGASDVQRLASGVARFVRQRSTGRPGEYVMCAGGHATLYASCFAAMTLHYVGSLVEMPASEKEAWIEYVNGWQDPETGLFIGPELAPEEMTLPHYEWDHHTMHLAAHVLPALHILGGRLAYPLHFARKFLDLDYLRRWLDRRDWIQAWMEGNNLLFVGQFLVYLRDFEDRPGAQAALGLYFDWLDAEQDPNTGLWGTQVGCPVSHAVFGGYHQLLVYYYCDRPVRHPERIIDSVLSLQHADGGFAPQGGGGACQDVDSADILVNLYKRTGFRPHDVRQALRRLLRSVLTKRTPDGGFVNRFNEPWIHHGILRTYAPPNVPELFSTWFRTHTIALACQILEDEPLAQFPWRFNTTCSMGWHRPQEASVPDRPSSPSPVTLSSQPETMVQDVPEQSLIRRGRSLLLGRPLRFALRRLPRGWAMRLVVGFVRRYLPTLPPMEALRCLLSLDQRLYPYLERYALDYGGRLLPTAWPTRFHHEFFVQRLSPGETVLHIGCGTGGLTYALAVLGKVRITGCDANARQVAIAQQRYPHPRLSYLVGDPLYVLPEHRFNAVVVCEAAEQTPGNPAYLSQMWKAMQPTRILMRVPSQKKTWQTLLRGHMCAETLSQTTWRPDSGSMRFFERLKERGLQVTYAENRWGETWVEVVSEASS